MMDYDASITYTTPVTRRTPCGPSRPPPRAGSSACGARCAAAPTPAAGATARSTRSSSTEDHEVDLPQTGVLTNYTIITPIQYPGQTETEPFARVHVLLDEHRRGHAATRTLIEVPNDEMRIGMRVAGGVGVGGRDGRRRLERSSLVGWMPTGEPDVDDPDLVNRIC